MNNQCDINQLFGEISWQGFIEQYWQKKSYYVQGQNTEYFASLISRQEIDTLIKTNGGKTDFVISLIGGKIVNPEKGVGHKAPSYWTAGNVFESFEKGSTIRLGNIASHCLSIRKLQQHFEANLQTDININLYLTPPGSRAFGAHYDDHDVFIVQISGSKIWKLFSPAEESPVEVLHRGRAGWLKKEMPGSKKVRPLPIPDEEWSVKMQAGDLLYVPRGHVHQVYSEDEESLHLTVAVTVVTWYEVVVQALLETLKESDALREALPPDISNRNFNTPYFNNRIAAVKADLEKHLTPEIMRDSVNEIARRFVVSRNPVPDKSAPIPEFSLITRMRIRPDMVYRVEENRREMVFYYSGSYLLVQYELSGVLEYILAQKEFMIADLPQENSELVRINFIRKLFEGGFFRDNKLMRDERMLDDYLREFVTQTPQDLIGKKSFQGILGTAHLLPGSVVLSTFGFECPLSSNEAEADFLVSFQKKNNGPFLLKLSAEKNFGRSAVWDDVGKLADFWAGKQLIDDFWLEFDIQGEAPLVPSLFFRPLYNSLAELEIILHYSLSALTGNESTAQLSSQVLQLVALLPDRARIFQIGAMRSRPVHGIRLCIHEISLDAILTFLKKIPYPGSVDELKEILIFLQPLVHDVAFSIDLSEGIGAKIGLECYVNPNFSAVEKQSAWTKMIDKFAEHDLIDAAKRVALKEFGAYTATGQLFKELPEELVRAMALMERHAVSTMWQYLHHLKITYDPGRPLLAKAYLSVQHTWR